MHYWFDWYIVAKAPAVIELPSLKIATWLRYDVSKQTIFRINNTILIGNMYGTYDCHKLNKMPLSDK